MGILDDITNMQNQGIQERDISKKLQEKGVSPKAIEDAFNQMRIKKAISAESSGEEGMEPSIMNIKLPPQAPPLYVPKTQEIEHEQEAFYTPQPPAPQFNEQQMQAPQYADYTQEEYAPQEGYVEQQGVGGGGSYDTDTIIEIAEQVFSEKIKKEQSQIEFLNEFATLAEGRISNDHERIKRVEDIIDKLQMAILEKVGSYGRNLDSIKNEMGMMQESFEKMVPSVHERNANNKEKKAQNNKEENYEEQVEGYEEEPQEDAPLPISKRKPLKTKK